ncbi:MAG: hypothetical protein [Circular genetic element sp.]|nr:MAG: hypothetical protein [Circular genetic element sp.]
MARKGKTSYRGNKIEPSAQTLTFLLPALAPGSSIDLYCDLSQSASLVNRRFYRQGINWAVAGFKLLTPGGFLGDVKISKLPNTWTMSNAWEKGMRAWTRMNNEALAETESVRPRFLDFKIYADVGHHAAGYGANLLPTSEDFALGAGVANPGEWSPSKINHPLASGAVEGRVIEEEIIAVGANYPGPGASGIDAVSLIEGYAASRGLPNIADPNTPDDARDTQDATPENWLGAMFNEGTDQTFEVLTDMITENTIAPYPFENDGVNLDTMYPGGANQMSGLQVHDIEFITGSTIGGTTRLKGGNFPCGLIKFSFTATSEAPVAFLQINLIPGSHRGYLCEPMTEM